MDRVAVRQALPRDDVLAVLGVLGFLDVFDPVLDLVLLPTGFLPLVLRPLGERAPGEGCWQGFRRHISLALHPWSQLHLLNVSVLRDQSYIGILIAINVQTDVSYGFNNRLNHSKIQHC